MYAVCYSVFVINVLQKCYNMNIVALTTKTLQTFTTSVLNVKLKRNITQGEKLFLQRSPEPRMRKKVLPLLCTQGMLRSACTSRQSYQSLSRTH